MRRNPIAWAALVVASAALLSSTGFLRPMPAAPKVTPESQRTAKALSEAFGAVAAFVKPSVVQISVHKKVIHPGARILLRLCGQRSRLGELILTLAETVCSRYGDDEYNDQNRETGMSVHCEFSFASLTRVWSVIQFTSQVLPPSSENDCSKCGTFGVGVRPYKSNKDAFAIEGVLRVEFTPSILKLTDLWDDNVAVLAVRPIETPLVRIGDRRVRKGETFDVAGGSIGFELFEFEPDRPNFTCYRGTVKFDPAVEPVNG